MCDERAKIYANKICIFKMISLDAQAYLIIYTDLLRIRIYACVSIKYYLFDFL